MILSIAVKYIGGDMKVQRKVTPREVNSARAVGLIKGGMSQGVVARQCNVSRKPVNYYWKRHLNGESLEDKERSGRPPVVAVAKISSARNPRASASRVCITETKRKMPRPAVKAFLNCTLNCSPVF